MAPTRYVQENRPTQGPAGDGHALAARDSDSAVQGHGTSSHDDGYYHPSIYQAGEKGQVKADDGSYPPKKKDSTTRQDSSLATAEQGSWGRQQGQGYESGSQSGTQYSGSQYGSSLGSGSQNTGSQYSGSQIPNSENLGSQSGADSGSESGSESGSQSSSYNGGAYQQSSNAQNAGQPQSHHVASNSSYPHVGQGVAAQQQANSDTANTDAQQQSSWSQQNVQDSHPKPKEPSPQSQGTPSNANSEGSSRQNNDNQAAEESHEQKNNEADSGAHASEEDQVDSAEENEPHNNHVAPTATVQTAQQPTHTLPWLTTETIDPTSSLTTSAAATDSTHTGLPTTSSSSSATSTPTPDAAKDSDDASYHKATGALAGLLGVAFVAGFVIFWFARRKRQQKSEANRSKMVRDAFRQSCANTKQRTSQFYTNFLGTAVGTGASALGAVRRSIAMPKFNYRREQSKKEPMPQEGHIHHPCDDGIYVRGQDLDDGSGHHSDRNDSIAAEKAAINESTPTLVVSPSESIARDQTPTVRRVISGRPQMESSESVEPKSGLSHNSQESEQEPNDKANEDSASAPLPAPDNASPDNGAQANGAQHTGAQDNGAQHTGAQDNGAQANGAQHTGAQDNGAQHTGAQANGAQHTGAQDNGAQHTGAQDNGAQDNGAQDNGAQHTGAQENAAEENGAPPRNGNGQNLLAVTSIVPSSTSVYRVEIAFQPRKVGQLDLREGQSIIIRQSFDDGWVLCTPADGGQEGLAPRACLSPWPIKNATSTSSSNYNLSDGTRTPESPTAPGTPRFYSHFYSARSVTQ